MRAWNRVLLANVVATALAAPAWCQIPDAGANMKKPMMDSAMMDEGMMMAHEGMMGMMADDTIVPAVAREMMIQSMMADESMMMAMDQKMMMKDDPQAKQMMANKVAAAKTALMKDKKAMMTIVQEVMLRRMVAAAIEMEMMHDPAATK